MKKKLWVLGLILLLVLVVGVIVRYSQWVQGTKIRLQSNRQISQTDSGQIEYASIGMGPAVLVLHGLKGGYDQGIVTANLLNHPDFQFIAVSRPGYLGTPLSTGRTPSEQADAFADLLDVLEIHKAAVIAQSAGGPFALEFALRYPKRCWGVVLISAVTMPKVEQSPSIMERLLSLLVDSDFGNWLMLGMVNRWPEKMIPLLITDPAHLEKVLNDPIKLDSIIQAAQSLALSSQRLSGTENDINQITRMDEIPVEEIMQPVMVIAGTGDDMSEDAAYIAKHNPNVQLILVDGGDHSTFTVFSDKLVPKVIDFLTQNSPTH